MTDSLDAKDQMHQIPFNLYSVEGWRGSANLDFFQVNPETGDVSEVWLIHKSTESTLGDQYILIGNLSAAEPSAIQQTQQPSAEYRDVALHTVIKVLNLGIPREISRLPKPMPQKMARFAESQADSWQSWPIIHINISGADSGFRTFRFGERIGACGYDGDKTFISLVCENVDLAQISLEQVVSSMAFGFDLSNGVRRRDLDDGSFIGNQVELHPDYSAFQ